MTTSQEQIEGLVRTQADIYYDGTIVEIQMQTVTVRQIGSRTVFRNVQVAEHIWDGESDTLDEVLKIGYKVRLGLHQGQRFVSDYFPLEEEENAYEGLGTIIPKPPVLTVVSVAAGWRVSWPAVKGADHYRLYRNDTPDGDTPEEVSYTTGRSVLISRDAAGTMKWFAATALSGLHESGTGNWVTDTSAPVAPVWASHTYRLAGHYRTWTQPTTSAEQIQYYEIFDNTSASDTGMALVKTTTSLTNTIPYTTGRFYLGIRAVDWAGNCSPVTWSGPFDPTPGVPVPTAQMVEFGGYRISWQAVNMAIGYEVQAAKDDAGTGAVTRYSGDLLYTGVIKETGYNWFRVRTLGYGANNSAWSAWVTDISAPPQPALATQGLIKSVSIGLAAGDTSHTAPGFSHYELEMATGAGGTGATTLDDHAGYESFPRIISQATGITRYYRLTPYDWAGNAGTPTTWVAVTPSEAGATVQDKFDGYGGSAVSGLESLYWLSMLRMETDEPLVDYGSPPGTPEVGWLAYADPLSRWGSGLVEGDNAIKVEKDPSLNNFDAIYYWWEPAPAGTPIDLSQESRFTNDDFIVFSFSTGPGVAAKLGNGGTIRFASYNSGYYYAIANLIITTPISYDTDQTFHVQVKRSSFSADPNFDWSGIVNMRIRVNAYDPLASTDYIVLDDMRIVKNDPDNPWYDPEGVNSNDTGRAWNFAGGVWHIYAGNRAGEPGKPFSLGQIATNGSQDYYLAYKPGIDITTGTVQAGAYLKADGPGILAFYIKETTYGQWTLYAIEANTVADTIGLVKWVDGVRTVIATAPFVTSPGQIIWLGADFTEYDTDGGRIKVYASLQEGNLIQAANLKLSVQDTEIGAGGTVGMITGNSVTRYVNFVAGSPAHAEVADVARALDGPIVAGETRRVRYNRDTNQFEFSDDGEAWSPVSGGITDHGALTGLGDNDHPQYSLTGHNHSHGNLTDLNGDHHTQYYNQARGDARYTLRTSANRPGVTRLYRRDADNAYNVQVHYEGGRWFLRGYNGDTLHAECRVGYADQAYNSQVQAIDHIQTQVLGADGNLVFYNIPQTYDHLLLISYARSARAYINDQLCMRFAPQNTGVIDSGQNYAAVWGNFRIDGVVNCGGNWAYTEAFGGIIEGNNSDWPAYTTSMNLIANYRIGLWKSFASMPGYNYGNWGQATGYVQSTRGIWRNTQPILHLQVFSYTTPFTFRVNSKFSLYGIKGFIGLG